MPGGTTVTRRRSPEQAGKDGPGPLGTRRLTRSSVPVPTATFLVFSVSEAITALAVASPAKAVNAAAPV